MFHDRFNSSAIACFLCFAGCAHFDYALPNTYLDVQLPPIDSEQSSYARAVSESQPYRVVGHSASNNRTLATIWAIQADGTSTSRGSLLPTADGHSSQALAVNDRGDVAGFETTKEGAHRAVLWRVGERVNLHEQLQNSPAMQGQTLISSKALFVDPLGNVAGEVLTAKKKRLLFYLQDESSEIYALENSGEETDVIQFDAVNKRGVAVVQSADNFPQAMTFNLIDAKANSIPLIPVGEAKQYSVSRAFDQNNSGHIVGETKQNNGATRAFLSVKGRYLNLGTLAGAQDSSAYGLNNKAKIVGKSRFADGRDRAFIWVPGYEIRALKTLASVFEFRELNSAFDINDADVVVGDGALMNRKIAFALIPGVSKERQLVSCLVQAPETVRQFDEVSVSILCTNSSNQTVSSFSVEAVIPPNSEVVAVSKQGGNLPPTSEAPNGRLQWSKQSLSPTEKVEYQFSILPLKSGRITFNGIVSVPNTETNEFLSFTFTKVEKAKTEKRLKLIGPPNCSSNAVGSVLDFEVLPLGFEPVDVSLEMGGEKIAKDTQAPFAFALENLSQGIHCVSVVATSSSGEEISSDPKCALVREKNEELITFRPVELSAGEHEASKVLSINQLGDAVGYVRNKSSETRAALWFADEENESAARRPTILPTEIFCDPGQGSNSIARDINSSGMIVGVCGPTWKQKSFLWNNGRFRPIKLEGQELRVKGINDSGQIVGNLGGTASQSSAFVGKFTANGVFTLQDLPGLGQDAFASAQAVNEFGVVIGNSHDLQSHAIVWKKGAPKALYGDGVVSRSIDISDSARPFVVGEFSTETNKHAFMWSESSGFTDIHNKRLGVSSGAHGINRYGQVVGSYSTKNNKEKRRAFLKTCSDTYDLNSLIPKDSGWILREAVGINAKGQIVGNGTHKGVEKAFVLVR